MRRTTLIHIAKADSSLVPNPWPPTTVEKKHSLWRLTKAYLDMVEMLQMNYEEPYLTLPNPQKFKKEAKRILASQPFPLTFGQKEWAKKWHPDYEKLHKLIPKLRLRSHIRSLLWRILNRVILQIPKKCPICTCANESIDHIFNTECSGLQNLPCNQPLKNFLTSPKICTTNTLHIWALWKVWCEFLYNPNTTMQPLKLFHSYLLQEQGKWKGAIRIFVLLLIKSPFHKKKNNPAPLPSSAVSYFRPLCKEDKDPSWHPVTTLLCFTNRLQAPGWSYSPPTTQAPSSQLTKRASQLSQQQLTSWPS